MKSLDITYDEKEDFFTINKKQLYWSSVYFLKKSKTGFNLQNILNEFKLNKREQELAEEELQDLEELGLVKYEEEIFLITDKGKKVLSELSKITPLSGLRKKARSDLKEVINQVTGIEKTSIKSEKQEANKEKNVPTRNSAPWEFILELFPTPVISLLLLFFISLFVIKGLISIDITSFVTFILGTITGYYLSIRYFETVEEEWGKFVNSDYLMRRIYEGFIFPVKSGFILFPLFLMGMLIYYFEFSSKENFFDPDLMWLWILTFGVMVGSSIKTFQWWRKLS